MIELKFYRDGEYVYINNPDGTTKRVAIEDFEDMFDVDTAELPAYTSSDAGKVLAVNSNGTGLEWDESGGGIDFSNPEYISFFTKNLETVDVGGTKSYGGENLNVRINDINYPDWEEEEGYIYLLTGFNAPYGTTLSKFYLDVTSGYVNFVVANNKDSSTSITSGHNIADAVRFRLTQ